MKAIRLYGPHNLRLDEVPPPEITPQQVLIRIEACGICPSDVRWWAGSRPIPERMKLPRIPGHEWVGEIVDVGSEVSEYQVGDRVAAYGQVVCGMCENCQRGIFNYCLNRQWAIEGGFSQYGRASAQGLLPIPEGLSYEEASFTEPLSCCINGTWRSDIQLGEDVVVVGAGPIGLLHVQLARLQGARVIATDLIPERLEVAKEVGAHEVVNAAQEDAVEQVKELTQGRGADAVIVATGARAAMEQGLQMAALHGNVNLFAGSYPPPEVPLNPNLIHYKELTLTGSHHFTPFTFQRALKLLEYGMIQVEPLISHRLPLDRTPEGFEIVVGQKGLKVVIFPQM
ncbi:MAG: zinc-binding dehydrogenase [Chloroflexota bacterium]|nr:zinc-binding dehydrogenase [Chloroflexota bacterium]